MPRAASSASGLCAAPRRSTSMYPERAVTGVRSSWDASAMKRRTRFSESCCTANATSIRSAMWSKAPASWPTSSSRGKSRLRARRSPLASSPAVTVSRRSGRSALLVRRSPISRTRSSSTPPPTASPVRSPERMLSIGAIGSETSTTAVVRASAGSSTPTGKPATRSEPTIWWLGVPSARMDVERQRPELRGGGAGGDHDPEDAARAEAGRRSRTAPRRSGSGCRGCAPCRPWWPTRGHRSHRASGRPAGRRSAPRRGR